MNGASCAALRATLTAWACMTAGAWSVKSTEFEDFKSVLVASNATDAASGPTTVNAFLSVAGVNLGLLVGQLLLFGILMNSPRWSRALAPRLQEEHLQYRRYFLLGWAILAWRGRKNVYWQDLDAMVILRFCALGIKLSFAGTLAACVLMPLYAVGTAGEEGLNMFNLSNLSANSNVFWCSIAVFIIIGLLFLHLVAVEWRQFIDMRKHHYRLVAHGSFGAASAQAARSILVEKIPENCKQRDGLRVRRYFCKLLRDDSDTRVHSVLMQADPQLSSKDPRTLLREAGRSTVKQMRPKRGLEAGGLDKEASGEGPVADDAIASTRLEGVAGPASEQDPREAGVEAEAEAEAEAAIFQRTGVSAARGAALRTARMGRGLCSRAAQAADLLQNIAVGGLTSSTAFVTFHSISDATIARQMLLAHGPHWRIRAAPEPRDVLWANAAVPMSQIQTRRLLTRALLVVIGIFWSVPIGLIQGWSNLGDPSAGSFFSESSFGKFLYSLLRDFLPVLAMFLLQFLLPKFFAFLQTYYVGLKSKSQVQGIVLFQNLVFQLLTLYVTVIMGSAAGSLHFQLVEIVTDPLSLFDYLRKEVPQVSGYFVNYLITRIGLSVPLTLFWPMLPACVKTICFCCFRRNEDGDVDEAASPIHCIFMDVGASMGLVMIIALTYSVIAPILMPICLFYFGLIFLTLSWQFSYVFEPEFDGFGCFWYQIETFSMVGLFGGALTMGALASVFSGEFSPSAEFWVLLVFTVVILACIFLVRSIFRDPSKRMSLDSAVEIDLTTQPHVLAELDCGLYLDPSIAAISSESSSGSESGESDAAEEIRSGERAKKPVASLALGCEEEEGGTLPPCAEGRSPALGDEFEIVADMRGPVC